MFGVSDSVELLREIRDYLSEISDKLDSINDGINDIKGEGIYNIEDIHSELVDIKNAIDV